MVPPKELKKLIKTISDYHEEIEDKWKDFFKVNDVTYIDKVKANDVSR